MKKTIVIIILVAAAVAAHAQLLFRISGGGLENSSYMLGTYHLLNGELLDSVAEYQETVAQCRQMYGEIDTTDPLGISGLQQSSKRVAAIPGGKTIFDVLSTEQVAVLDSAYKEVFHVCLSDSAWAPGWTFQPVYHIGMLNMFFGYQELGRHHELPLSQAPMDVTILAKASLRGLDIGQLDQIVSADSLTKTDEEQMNISAQIDTLMKYVTHLDENRQKAIEEVRQSIRMVDYWLNGDYIGFSSDSIVLAMVEKMPQLLKGRNERWLPIVQEAMRKAPTMFVFGMLHLVGRDGIVELLRQAGYQVEQLAKH